MRQRLERSCRARRSRRRSLSSASASGRTSRRRRPAQARRGTSSCSASPARPRTVPRRVGEEGPAAAPSRVAVCCRPPRPSLAAWPTPIVTIDSSEPPLLIDESHSLSRRGRRLALQRDHRRQHHPDARRALALGRRKLRRVLEAGVRPAVMISAVSRLSLGCLSAVSRLYRCCISRPPTGTCSASA